MNKTIQHLSESDGTELPGYRRDRRDGQRNIVEPRAHVLGVVLALVFYQLRDLSRSPVLFAPELPRMQMQAICFRFAASAIPSSVRHPRPKLRSLYLQSSSRSIFTPTSHVAFSSSHRNLSPKSTTALNRIKEPRAKDSVFIFRSSSTDPYINLSLEHFLLQNGHPDSRILFLYVNRPCVVIGRNQNPWVECALRRLSQDSLSLYGDAGLVGSSGVSATGDGKREVLLVRRRSGGGAVFHDEGNLNYSVIVPSHAKAEFKRKTHAEMVVRAVRGVLKDLTQLSTPSEALKAAAETTICPYTGALGKTNVRVNDRNDIVMDDPQKGVLKISGSAFKLTKGRALHHGTLLFSSPNIKGIGEFLRSPAREFISAKGVESVRSPVGNLFDLLLNERYKTMLRSHLETGIAEEFRKMYGEEANGRSSSFRDGSTPTRRESPEDIVSEVEESTEAGAEIMKAVREIISPEWKFEQTPGFVVSTRPVESEKGFSPPTRPDVLPEGANVIFRVKHGIIQEAELSLSSEAGAATQEKKQIRPRLQGRKLHEISDWKSVFVGLDAWNHPNSGRLAEWLSNMFPPLSKSPIQTLRPGPTPEKIENEIKDGDVVKRHRADGTFEAEEQDEQAVNESQTSDDTQHGKQRS
jgi:lipoate-protein ligase A